MGVLGKALDLAARGAWGATRAAWKLALSEPVLAVAAKALPSSVVGPDSDRLKALWRSAMREYRQDIAQLPLEAFRPDLVRLLRACGSALLGVGDETDQAAGRQLRELLQLEARVGPEVLSDPARTEVAPTPRVLVHRQGSIELYRYRARGRRRRRGAPVLIAYSIINRSFILDLLAGFSFVEHLLDRGLDVYLIEWGEAKPFDRRATLDAFIAAIGGCVRHIRETTGAPAVSLFGHCIGGVLASVYAALHPTTVDRLVALTTPFTAGDGGLVAFWSDRRVFPVDAVVDRHGVMPGKLIRAAFMTFKPYLELMKWKLVLDCLGDERAMPLFAAVDRWANDNPDVHGEVFRRFIKEVYHRDGLRQGRTRIGARRVDLGRITCPVLNVVAERDWIVPASSAEVLGLLVKSRDYRLLRVPKAFHVSLLVQPAYKPAWQTISDFLLEGGAKPALSPGTGAGGRSRRRAAR